MDMEENSAQQQQQQVEADVFDLLPDAIVLEIFNRVEDAKSLSACSILCKRFGDLVTQTHNVSLEIIRQPDLSNHNMNQHKSGFVDRFILNPIQALLLRFLSRKPKKTCSHCCDDDQEEDKTFRLPNDLLKTFKEIRSLSVKLPGHEGDISSETSSGAVLKWKAEFGKDLQSCVILGATGFRKSQGLIDGKDDVENHKDDEVCPDTAPVGSNLTNKQLKKRVVWTISCLIASSARHHMLKQIISLNHLIRDVKISDGSKQGTIQMTEGQVVELRNEMNSRTEATTEEPERTRVPAVTIKMWYMPVLELPESGGVMRGATLAVIRPAVATVEKVDDVTLAMGAFEEKGMTEAVRKLIEKKTSYTLEMNSF